MNENIGYYRYPAIRGDSIVFVCEDALWSVSTAGGSAKRLTANEAQCSFPRFSPDGSKIAFVGQEEGHSEVYVIPATGGVPKRLTYLGGRRCYVTGWSSDGQRILFTNTARSPLGHAEGYSVSVDGGMPRPMRWGHMFSMDIHEDGTTLIGRNNLDPARWKRYRGGMCGEIWVDTAGNGKFKRLIELNGNMVSPMWVGDRAFFLSDHEGMGNIYSCLEDGSDLRKHTNHTEYYVRFPSTDGKRIVYTAGSNIYLLDPKSDSTMIAVTTPSTTTQLTRKFVPATNHFEHWAPHPKGHSLALIARGQPFTLANWEGAPIQHGVGSSVRYRLSEWLPDGKRFVVVCDHDGEEHLEVHTADQSKPAKVVTKEDIGRVVEMLPSPVDDVVAITNHRRELWLVNLKGRSKKEKLIDSSDFSRIFGLAWSPDGKWLAYAYPVNRDGSSRIRVADTWAGKVRDVTTEIRRDFAPAFDPSGSYLYFLSDREFMPVADGMYFDYSFPATTRPYVVTLRKDVPSPFVTSPRPIHDGSIEKSTKRTATQTFLPAEKVAIDFDGIEKRVLAFPGTSLGQYGQIIGSLGRVYFTQFDPMEGARAEAWTPGEGSTGSLLVYDFEEERYVNLTQDAMAIRLAHDFRTLFYENSDQEVRAIDALQQELHEDFHYDDAVTEYSRHSGWLDLQRVQVMVTPREEWTQMFNEAWRLQRDHFWDPQMSGIDWNHVHERYSVLLPRIRTRAEFSDLLWEMQGELGTSHAYEWDGDYPETRDYSRGFLGAELSWLEAKKGYKIVKIIEGDSWDENNASPLAAPGVNINEGDVIVAVGGRAVSKYCTVEELLLSQSGQFVNLTIADEAGKKRNVAVKTLKSEANLRYRAWVEANREYVHAKSEGRIGYVHIPDMDVVGISEFFRGYLKECDKDALVVDVRNNGGGNVSQLILRMLMRRPLSYDAPRWMQPQHYPDKTVAGPIVAVTDQFAGSDGDIFSHSFKLLKIGKLIGKRTWGGVIGIAPSHALVDGTLTTQPEYATYFLDKGWNIENHGAEPDIDVDIAPQHFRMNRDPQLDKAIAVVFEEMATNPPLTPNFKDRPQLPLPFPSK